MVFRRVAALGFLALVLGVFVSVPSCSDCADGGVGCPCETPQDCNIAGPCVRAFCSGTCVAVDVAAGFVCVMNPCNDPAGCNGVCTDGGECVQCFEDYQCDPGRTCEAGNVCTSCHDGIQNGDETGIDCGGAGCPVCPGTCKVDADCPDGDYCWEGLCVSCSDGIKNGDEWGVDCGREGDHCGVCLGFYCGLSSTSCASFNGEDWICCASYCPLCYGCAGDGECRPIASGYVDYSNKIEPGIQCLDDHACDGYGKCLLAPGQTCTLGPECSSHVCINRTCTKK